VSGDGSDVAREFAPAEFCLGPWGRTQTNVYPVNGWRCVQTPGNTSFQRLDDGVLITGDALVTLLVNSWAGMLLGRQGLAGPPWYTTWDRQAADASMRTIAGRRPSVLAPGHGPPLRGPATAAAIERAVDRWQRGRSAERHEGSDLA
jgi:glyoxylase-like metal-dependent hydrolase (beta-lactamase superfamily II)